METGSPVGAWLVLARWCGLCLCALWCWGCADAGSPAPGGDGGCQCAASEVCVQGTCRQRCAVSQDCGAGRFCSDGACLPESGCQVDGDCQRRFNDPRAVCREGGCFILMCVDGDEQPCATACGTGTEYCRGGVWRGCTAPMERLEVCGDGIDNDCDSATDEDCGGCVNGAERPCQTECGTGVELCLEGWRGCTAQRPQPFEVCGDGVDNDCNGQIDEGCDDCEGEAPRECRTSCGAGTETCVSDTWVCDAPKPEDELCDGMDNDCDGEIDEEIARSCTNACGSGIEVCSAGRWGGCTAPEVCDCAVEGAVDQQVCGVCGFRERTCADRRWSGWGACQEGGQCQPGQEEQRECGACGVDRRVCGADCAWGDWQGCKAEGVCEGGAVEEEACGTCGGARRRECLESCAWGDWGECSVPPGSQCAPGAREERACDRCGAQVRVCEESCSWGEWSRCEGQGECEPGEEGARSCGGACQAQVRVCDDQCTWGGWGECSGGGQCAPGQRETGACGACGTRERSCGDGCVWGAWTACRGEGTCSPGEREDEVCGQTDVGLCSYGARTRTCNGQCAWGAWGSCLGSVGPTTDTCGDGLDQDCDGMDDRRPDSYEPNNTCASAYNLGTEPDNRVLSATIDTAADTDDYYVFTGVDDTFTFGREVVRVTLEDVPGDADYDLYLYRGLSGCQSGSSLAQSVAGGRGDDEMLEWVEALNFDDEGQFYVRVRRYAGNACFSPYRLTVHGLR